MNEQDYNKRFSTTEMGDQVNPPSNTQNLTANPVDEEMQREQTRPGTDASATIDLDKEPIASDAVVSLDDTVYEDARLSGLLDHEDSERFRHRWNDIQSMFIDDPHAVVKKADALVSEVITHLSQELGDKCHSLTGQWAEKDNVSTEDLRVILQRYRALFNRIIG